MKRAQVYIGSVFGVVCVWLGLLLQRNDLVAYFTPFQIRLLNLAPVIVILAFGLVCAAKLVHDLLTFNNYPKEIRALETDIKLAREDLKRRGI